MTKIYFLSKTKNADKLQMVLHLSSLVIFVLLFFISLAGLLHTSGTTHISATRPQP